VPGAGQFVNGDDARVFELAGDLRLLEEARLERGVLGALGPQLLQGDVPAQVVVVRQPDAADAAGRVQTEPAIAFGRTGNVVDGRHGVRLCRERPSGERALDVVVAETSQGALDVVGDGREAGVDVTAVFAQLVLEEVLDVGLVGRLKPAALHEQV